MVAFGSLGIHGVGDMFVWSIVKGEGHWVRQNLVSLCLRSRRRSSVLGEDNAVLTLSFGLLCLEASREPFSSFYLYHRQRCSSFFGSFICCCIELDLLSHRLHPLGPDLRLVDALYCHRF
jgi:hypothetical protein